MPRIGTSGWSYDSWVGPVYPRHLRDRRSEWLSHYALTFTTVEVNTTFYQLPMAETVASWADRVGDLDGFEMTLKAPRKVTHRAMVDGDEDATREGLVELVDRTEPLASVGARGAFLLQLSPHLHDEPGERAMLETALSALVGVGDVAVELRHRSWVRDGVLDPRAAGILADHGASVVTVDGPSFPTLTEPTGDHAYVRFHGRRGDVWFEGADMGDHDRYDYRYGPEELRPWVETIDDLDAAHDRVRVYFNNHPDGKAFKDADALREMLDLPRPDRPRGGQQTLEGFDG